MSLFLSAATFSENYEVFTRLVFAVAAGALVGIEREYHGRPAGLRTHILVTLGAALVAVISTELPTMSLGSQETLRVDPGRIAAGVVTGIGFLGAGAIIRIGVTARGLTTAASLWCMAGVGMAFGFGFHVVGSAAVVLVLITLFLIGAAEKGIARHWYKTVEVTVDGPMSHIDDLNGRFKKHDWRIIDLKISKRKEEPVLKLAYDMRLNAKHDVETLVGVLSEVDFVRDFSVS